jgi:flagellar hook-associated protein 2
MATTSSASSSISALGTGSGLDLSTLLTNLVSAEKAPQQQIITQRQTAVSTTVSALGALKSSASALQDAFEALKDVKAFNARTATSNNKDMFTATADSTADLGNYSINVVNLASANKVASGNFAATDTVVGTGKMTIAVGTTAFDLEIGEGNKTLAGIRDAINSAPGNNGIKASIMQVSDGNGGKTNKLVLAAKETGASSQISITVTDTDGNNTDATGLSQLYYSKADTTNSRLTEMVPAKDATLIVDGFEVTSKTNVFTEAIPGVTLTALKGAEDPDDLPAASSLAVSFDKEAVKKALDKFVSAYNAYAFTYGQLTSYNKETDTAGPLLGNSAVGLLANKIRQGLTNPVPGTASDFNSLSNLGITTNADGTLKVDAAKLDKALTTRLDDVAKLFAGDDGIAGRMHKQLGDSLSTTGLFQNTQDTLQKQLDGLKEQQTKLDARMVAREAHYRAQFTALDTIVAQLKQTGNFLTQQFAPKSDS